MVLERIQARLPYRPTPSNVLWDAISIHSEQPPSVNASSLPVNSPPPPSVNASSLPVNSPPPPSVNASSLPVNSPPPSVLDMPVYRGRVYLEDALLAAAKRVASISNPCIGVLRNATDSYLTTAFELKKGEGGTSREERSRNSLVGMKERESEEGAFGGENLGGIEEGKKAA
eukprot:1175553-Prorocentrum_minimum.AAC.2